jgi:hypothetical protein
MNETQGNKDAGRVTHFLRHPFFLLILGTALSYVFIPWISEKSAGKRLLQESRINRATDILRQGLIDDERLNSMQTAFEIFQKHAASDPDNYKSAQKEFREYFDKVYLEFDQHAWWWDHDLPVQGRVLGLPSDRLDRIEKLHDNYVKNLIDASRQVDVLRALFLAKDYKPEDPHNAEALAGTRKALDGLLASRDRIASDLAGVFMPQGQGW